MDMDVEKYHGRSNSRYLVGQHVCGPARTLWAEQSDGVVVERMKGRGPLKSCRWSELILKCLASPLNEIES